MSQENVEIVRRAYEEFRRTRTFAAALSTPDFIWDMSHFQGWPEQQLYEGVPGAERFLRDWLSTWEQWDLQLDELRDAGGDKVFAVLTQRGRAKTTGLAVDMSFAQIWTIRDGLRARMEMYSDVDQALEALGLQD